MVEGKNNLILTNTAALGMYIDQIIYVPAGTPEEKFLVSVRQDEHGTVTPDVSEAAEGQIVRLSVTPQDGYQLKELRIINSVYYTMAKSINVTDPNNITFVMPDDNVTLQPVFEDMTSVYKIDFTSVMNGTMPEGWRVIQENNDVHEYPNSYDSGSRVMAGFAGYQGKALYWRNGTASYGQQTGYRMTLEEGSYKLTYVMGAWKGTPKYKVQMIDAATNKAVASSVEYTATLRPLSENWNLR